MNDLDDRWTLLLEQAMQRASAEQKSGVADYLRLKIANDLVRQAGVRWLFDSIIEIATTRDVEAAGVTVERLDPHNFSSGGANLVGSMLEIRHGIRLLRFEAGWTRTPNDGFIRGGALAIAKISHFGRRSRDVELSLNRNAAGRVAWFDRAAHVFDGERLMRHFDLFLER